MFRSLFLKHVQEHISEICSGAFICIYVGNLFEADEGNKQGQNYGDEYFADLDMIEMVEKRKVRLWKHYFILIFIFDPEKKTD